MGSGDIGIILVAGIAVVGGLYLVNNPQALQNIKNIFNQQPTEEVPPPTTEAGPEPEPEAEPEPEPEVEDEPPPEPEVITQTEYVPYPVSVPAPRPPSRAQICSREYGGSCSQECRQYGYSSEICQDCISYCGYPPPEYPRPRHYIPDYNPPRPRPRPPRPRQEPPRPQPFPKPGRECKRGERYDWEKKKCVVVPKEPRPRPTPTPAPAPMPDNPPSSSPDAGVPESTGQPAASNYAGWY